MQCIAFAADPGAPAVYEEADPLATLVPLGPTVASYEEADPLLHGDRSLFFACAMNDETQRLTE